MNHTELAALIANGENWGLDFKRDDLRPERLAKEMAALLNLEGGHILLGVEDDGSVSGLTRSPRQAEEWVMEAARTHLRPAAIPFSETLHWDQGRVVGIIGLPADAPDKPYKAKRGSAWVTQVRVGTTSGTRPTRRRPGSICSPGACSTTAAPSRAPRWRTWTRGASSTISATSASRSTRRPTTPTAGNVSWSTLS